MAYFIGFSEYSLAEIPNGGFTLLSFKSSGVITRGLKL